MLFAYIVKVTAAGRLSKNQLRVIDEETVSKSTHLRRCSNKTGGIRIWIYSPINGRE